MEISDWSDLRQFDGGSSMNFGSNNENKEQKKDWTKNQNEDSQMSEQQQQNDEGGGGDDISSFEVTDWNDLRKFDDDHDDDWFKYQEKLMADQYGGNFIKVKYSSNGRVAYFCELCLAECNAKKSLELHCSGMKHLKKKDMWEKEGKPQPPISLSGENGQPKVPPGESSRDRRRTRTRSPPPLMRKRMSPPRGRGGIGSAERARYDRSREPPRGYGNDYDRDMHAPPYDYDRFYQRGRYYDEHDDRDRYGPPAPGGYGSVDPLDSRGPPGLPRYSPKRERGYSPVTRRDYGHGREKKYPDYEERRPSPIRPRYYGDKRSRSPEKKRSPYGSKREKGRSPYSPRNKRSPRRDSPYKVATPPSPPKISSSRKEEPEKKVNLANSPAGSLLQKLAECCVKSSEDADLALNVVAALTKSLKEYCQRNEETKLAELLMEAELKVGTVKALKAGMKMLSNFTADAGTANISPGNVFPTFLGINHPPPTHSQPPMPPPTHAPSMYGTSSQSGHFNY